MTTSRTIVREPQRLTGWPVERWAGVVAGVVLIAGANLQANLGHGSWWTVAVAFLGGVELGDAANGFWLTFRLFGLPRYLRWSIRCRRGRRCAYLQVDDDAGAERMARDGLVLERGYTCGSCGTRYLGRYEPTLDDALAARRRNARWS